jgi:hypothetical protein
MTSQGSQRSFPRDRILIISKHRLSWCLFSGKFFRARPLRLRTSLVAVDLRLITSRTPSSRPLFHTCRILLSVSANLPKTLSKSGSLIKITMLPSVLFTALAAALSLTFENAAPASARPLKSRDSVENSYVVRLKDGVNTTSHINSLPFPFSVEDENSPVTHWWPDDFFKGYSGIFVGAALEAS